MNASERAEAEAAYLKAHENVPQFRMSLIRGVMVEHLATSRSLEQLRAMAASADVKTQLKPVFATLDRTLLIKRVMPALFAETERRNADFNLRLAAIAAR